MSHQLHLNHKSIDMSNTRQNRKFAIPAIVSVVFVASVLWGLTGRAAASTITLVTTTPTIASISTSTSSPYTTPGGYSSNYRNATDASTYNPVYMFNGSGTKTITVGAGNSLSYSGTATYVSSGINSEVTPNGNPASGSGADQGDQNDIDPLIATNYGSSVSANVIVFALRDTTLGDRTSQINLWFSNSPFTVSFSPASDSGYVAGASGTGLDAGTYGVNGSSLASLGSPTESIAITDTSNTNLTEYAFPDGVMHSGRYVLMQFIDSDGIPGQPGASAFALGTDTAVPEPATFSAAGFALSLLGLRRRRA
jgi:hypothetical protein